MAIFTNTELAEMRLGLETVDGPIDTIKAEINAALQAIEDTYQSDCRLAWSNAIDAATTFNFTNAQKKLLGKWWMKKRFNLGG